MEAISHVNGSDRSDELKASKNKRYGRDVEMSSHNQASPFSPLLKAMQRLETERNFVTARAEHLGLDTTRYDTYDLLLTTMIAAAAQYTHQLIAFRCMAEISPDDEDAFSKRLQEFYRASHNIQHKMLMMKEIAERLTDSRLKRRLISRADSFDKAQLAIFQVDAKLRQGRKVNLMRLLTKAQKAYDDFIDLRQELNEKLQAEKIEILAS